MPRSVYGSLAEFAGTWDRRGVRAWADSWWNMAVTTGDAIAPLIGARPGEISMHANVSLLQAVLISCFDFRGKRNRVVLTEMEFPSVLYVYRRFAAARGARLKFVPSEDGIGVDTQRIVDAIDDRTLLVPVSHVLFRSAYVQDLRAITEKAHRHGAAVVADGYHSIGILPFDARALGVDAVVGGVLKWLCGGPGGAFLWVRPSLRKKLRPEITGWLAHRQPFAFRPGMSYAGDAFRFLNGTPAVPALYSAREGPRIIARAGVEKIRSKSLRQTSLIIAKAQEYGFGVRTPLDPVRRGGAVTLRVPRAYEVSRELLRRDIIVDFREGAGIRIAPHFYTRDEEITGAMDQIREILSSIPRRSRRTRRDTVT